MLRLARLTIIFILTAVVLATAVNVYSNWLWFDIFTRTITSQVISLTVLGLMLAAIPIIQRIEKRSQSEKEFRLIKRSEKLTPQDLNFEIVEGGKTAASVTHRRPYAPGTYLQRTAVPYARRQSRSPSSVQDESHLCQLLRRGKNVLLVGPPTDGKIRTLLELVDRMRGYSVVIPHHDAAPSESAIQLLRDKKVILLLDDLKNYESGAVNLIELHRGISNVATSCVMLATSRLGPGLMLASSYESAFGRLLENFETYSLVPPTIEQQHNLARLLNQTFSEAVPTLGFISMRDAFELMRKRFDTLPPTTQECFRALQLLAAGGIEPYESSKVHMVIRSIFGRNIDSASVRDALTELSSHGFIAYSPTEPAIHPHTTYLVGPAASIFYGGQAPENALMDLARSFQEQDDFKSANTVGLALLVNQRRTSALEVWQRTVELLEGHTETNHTEAVAVALFNKGMALDLMDDAGAGIAAYDALLEKFKEPVTPRIASIVAKTLSAKARTLAEIKKYDDALASISVLEQRYSQSEDLDIRISVARSREYRAGVHALTNDTPAAESAYTEISTIYDTTTAIELKEVLAFAQKNLARIWADRGEYDRAIAQCDQIIARFSEIKRPRMAGVIAQTLLEKAIALFKQNRLPEASVPLQQLYRDFGASNSQETQRTPSIADRSEHAIMAPSIGETVAHGLSLLHGIHVESGMYAEADIVLTHLLKDFGDSDHPGIEMLLVNALRNRAAGLFEVGDSTAALDACRELGRKYGSDTDVAIREACATALATLAEMLYKQGARLNEAAAVLTGLVDLFKNDPSLRLRVVAASSMTNLSIIFATTNRNRAVVDICDEVIALFSSSDDAELKKAVDTAYINRAVALGRMGIL